jgi:hypothetical protein
MNYLMYSATRCEEQSNIDNGFLCQNAGNFYFYVAVSHIRERHELKKCVVVVTDFVGTAMRIKML